MNTDKILCTFRNAVSRGQTELATALYESLGTVKSKECDDIKTEATKVALKCESNDKETLEPVYTALQLHYLIENNGLTHDTELLQFELLLRLDGACLSDSTKLLLRNKLYSQQDNVLHRRAVTLNTALSDVCKHIPELSFDFMEAFRNLVIIPGNLDETFQANIVSCLKRFIQKNKATSLEVVRKYLQYIDVNNLGADAKCFLQNYLVHLLTNGFEGNPKGYYSALLNNREMKKEIERICLVSLQDKDTATLLGNSLKEVRQELSLNGFLLQLLEDSIETFLLGALYASLDSKTILTETILNVGKILIRKREFDKVKALFDHKLLVPMKPVLLGVTWDSCHNNVDQSRLLLELNYQNSTNDKFIIGLYKSTRDQVEVGSWYEQHVKPLITQTWNMSAVSGSRSTLHVIISQECIESLGQDTVLKLLFSCNETDNGDPNLLPLSDAPNTDQGKDIVTFCSAMVTLNLVEYLNPENENPELNLTIAKNHMSRVYPLYRKAITLQKSFTALIHALKNPKNTATLKQVSRGVAWFTEQIEQFESDSDAFTLGEFDTNKIFRDLAANSPGYSETFKRLKDMVTEAEWRIGLLSSIFEVRKLRKSQGKELNTSLLSLLCSRPQDLLRLCLICHNNERAVETLQRYSMQTDHLAQVVNFQNHYRRSVKELRCFGDILKQQEFKSSVNSLNNFAVGSIGTRVRTTSTSSASSLTSTKSSMSRISSQTGKGWNVAIAASNISTEKMRVPAIVSKLTSTITKQQLMIEHETLSLDNDVLISRLLADIGTTIATHRAVGIQLLSMALERITDMAESPIERYIKTLSSTMALLDAKPYRGVTIANCSPREFLNSIYPCIPYEVIKDLLKFNETQEVVYNDLKNAVKDDMEQPKSEKKRMVGALESARDVLNDNNFSTFLCKDFIHRDYLGSLLLYLEKYTAIFNAILTEASVKKEVEFSPTRIFNEAPAALMGQLMIDDGIPPKLFYAAAEFLSVNILQIIILSSFPHICMEEVAAKFPSPPTVSIVSSTNDGEPTMEAYKISKVLSAIQEIGRGLTDVKSHPVTSFMSFFENTVVKYDGYRCSGMDLINLLCCNISHFKPIAKLKPVRFDPHYIFGLLLGKKEVCYTEGQLITQLTENCRNWMGRNTFIDAEINIMLHPVAYIAFLILKRNKDFVKEFLCVYTDVVCDVLGGEIESLLDVSKDKVIVFEQGKRYFLGKNRSNMIPIVIKSTFDFRYKGMCKKCKDIDSTFYRREISQKIPAFDYVFGYNESISHLGYMFNSLHPSELDQAKVILDDALMSEPWIQNYISILLEPYTGIIEKEYLDRLRIENDPKDQNKDSIKWKHDLLGCLLLGGHKSKFVNHLHGSMLEYHISKDQFVKTKEVFDVKNISYVIPYTILCLALDDIDPDSKDFIANVLNIEDKLQGLKYVQDHYQVWPLGVAIDCFIYFNEVLSDYPSCIGEISQSLEMCSTLEHISKILNYQGIEAKTCKVAETYIKYKPEHFSELMMLHKEFQMCHNAVKFGWLSVDHHTKILVEHVIFMASNDNYDLLDIYNVLDDYKTEGVCEMLCQQLQKHTSNLKVMLQMYDIILNKFEDLLTERKKITIRTQRLGALFYQDIKKNKITKFDNYKDLQFTPLIIIEQLIMNLQIHLAAVLVDRYQADIRLCGLNDNLDELVVIYIKKSLHFEGARICTSDTTSTATFSTRTGYTPRTLRSARSAAMTFNPRFHDNSKRNNLLTAGPPKTQAKWVPSNTVKKCQNCSKRFKVVVRKHHCRWCGKVMCGDCSPMRAPVAYFGASVRLCTPCFLYVKDGKHINKGNQNALLTDDEVDTAFKVPFELLSTRSEKNLDNREQFTFSGAPSSEICLCLTRLMVGESASVLLSVCEKLSATLMESLKIEIDYSYGHVLTVIETVLIEARNKFWMREMAAKAELTTVYITYTQICRRISLSDLVDMPGIQQLVKPDVLHETYMKLLDKQYSEMAIRLCTKAGRDASALWKKWGFSCLRAGDYNGAREKLGMCLANKQYAKVLLREVIYYFENCIPMILVETTDINEFMTGIRKKCRKQQLNSVELEECVYYLEKYSSPGNLLKFFIKHELFDKAFEAAIKHDGRMVFEGILRPLIKLDKLHVLFDYISNNRSHIQTWQELLTDCCDKLNETGELKSIYEVQIFLRDYIKAAKTAILMLRNTMFLTEQEEHLSKAENCFKLHLDPKNLATMSSLDKANNLKSINIRLAQVHLQGDILKLMKSKNIAENNLHIFSSQSDKINIIKKLYQIDNFEAVPIIKKIIDIFSLPYIDALKPLLEMISSSATPESAVWFPKLMKLVADLPAEEHDELLTCYCLLIKADSKQFKRVIPSMKTDKSKIRAHVAAGNLKDAYITAVNKKLKSEIEWLMEECDRRGDDRVKEFCQKYLEHNRGK